MSTCPTCNAPVIDAEVFTPGVHRYADTLGGHADRHGLAIEAAERIVRDDLPAALVAHYSRGSAAALVDTIASHCPLHDATYLDAACPSCAQGVPPVEAS